MFPIPFQLPRSANGTRLIGIKNELLQEGLHMEFYPITTDFSGKITDNLY